MNIQSQIKSDSSKGYLAEGIREYFHDRYIEDIPNQLISFDEFLKANSFFITLNPRIKHSQTAMSEFAYLYYSACKAVIGCSLRRKVWKQPLTFAFIDFEGTRSRQTVSGISTMPHLHAVSLARPSVATRFKQALVDLSIKHPNIADIEVRNFDQSLGSVENLVTYCMKGYAEASPQCADRDFCFEVFPTFLARPKGHHTKVIRSELPAKLCQIPVLDQKLGRFPKN